jgi:hypothetical protein
MSYNKPHAKQKIILYVKKPENKFELIITQDVTHVKNADAKVLHVNNNETSRNSRQNLDRIRKIVKYIRIAMKTKHQLIIPRIVPIDNILINVYCDSLQLLCNVEQFLEEIYKKC